MKFLDFFRVLKFLEFFSHIEIPITNKTCRFDILSHVHGSKQLAENTILKFAKELKSVRLKSEITILKSAKELKYVRRKKGLLQEFSRFFL